MFGLFRTILDDAYLCLMALAILCAPAGLFAETLQSPSQENEDPSKCRDLYQGVSDEPMREALDPDAVESGRLKVCGASPSCSSCKEMRPGDCSYVFPSNVFVYPSKKKGYEEICACTVFACSLPWDPAGWNKKCMKELGCYKKPPYGGIWEFPDALCGGDRGNYVKFGPMAFSLQSYSKPGVVAYEYTKRKLVEKRYVFPKKISEEYLKRSDIESNTASTGSTATSARNTIWKPEGLDKGRNSLESNTGTKYYFAYRRPDYLCIRYYGENSRLDGEFEESCLPIPQPDPPLLYSSQPRNSTTIYTLVSSRYKNQAYKVAVLKRQQDMKMRRVSSSDISHTIESTDNKILEAVVNAQQVGLRTEYDEGWDWGNESVKRAVILPCDVEYNLDEAQKGEGCFFKKCSQFEGKANISGIRAFKGFPSRGVSSLSSGFLGKSDFLQGECRFADAHREDRLAVRGVNKPCEYSGGRIKNEHQGSASSAYHVGYVACAERHVISTDREFEVLHKAKCAAASSNTGDDENKLCNERIRVKKKPKMLRRYVLIESGDVKKRIRCDDKYDIDLRTIGQSVLDNAEISGNRFKFPSEYLSRVPYDAAGSDPCANPSYDIEYFYEDGGFITGVDLRECSNPVEEYFAIGRSISGCEYDYVRTDNYQPYLHSVPGKGYNASIVPLSRYEQGLCVDNFRSTWFTPSYRPANGASMSSDPGPVGFFCAWGSCTIPLGGVQARTDGDAGETVGVRNVYRYPIVRLDKKQSLEESSKDADFLFGKNLGCSLYKIEMWGGGQAAVTEATSNMKRSGRPGQYAMLVLDFEKLQRRTALLTSYREATRLLDPKSGSVKNVTGSKYSLVMEIGEGGFAGTTSSVKGGDTKLQLCEAQSAQGAAYQEKCYDIASVVGGGSGIIGAAPTLDDFIVYYRTITGDVLENDVSSRSLLENHNAMFTKFSLTMNLQAAGDQSQPEDARNRMKKILENRSYFDGRSAPSQFCSYKSKRSEAVNIFVPGMGGCWSELSGGKPTEQSKPGVGENGAVMITCERWGDAS